ncbi:MAG TPA: hypothetical protein VHU84_18280 [Lacipirellulaceae bacterium]|jgi:hypothetical protein|nr:hypothetical protein [Lacipirellulaceae bacterium]
MTLSEANKSDPVTKDDGYSYVYELRFTAGMIRRGPDKKYPENLIADLRKTFARIADRYQAGDVLSRVENNFLSAAESLTSDPDESAKLVEGTADLLESLPIDYTVRDDDEMAAPVNIASRGAKVKLPEWSSDTGELIYDGKVLCNVAGRAKNLRLLLAAFDGANWVHLINNPLLGAHPDPQTLGHVVKQLNEKQKVIKFRRDGGGKAVWELHQQNHNGKSSEPQ